MLFCSCGSLDVAAKTETPANAGTLTYAEIQAAREASTTPLMRASEKGELATVEQLLTAGADLNVGDYNGQTAIYKACAARQTEVVKLLIKARANVNIATKYGSESPITVAAEKGYEDILTLLIKAGAQINPKLNNGFTDSTTALMAAASKGQAGAVKLLIKAKARLNDQDDKGRTALFRASEAGHTEVVKIFIKAGAKLNLLGPAEHTALSFAGNDEIRRLLTAAGAK